MEMELDEEMIKQLDKDYILSDEIMGAVIELNKVDCVDATRAELALEERAQELGVQRKFKKTLKAYKDQEKKSVIPYRSDANHVAIFTSCKYPVMNCSPWLADDSGIKIRVKSNEDALYIIRHPIIPAERLIDVHTGMENIKIAFKRDGGWKEIIVPKEVIANSSKIVQLASRGVGITSETAKSLVKYLNDVEMMNEDKIVISKSSKKLGWVEDVFLPYDDKIQVDDSGYSQMLKALEPSGDYSKWLSLLKDIRKTAPANIKLYISAAFASVLVSKVGCLPFIVDLNGMTEGGKSVALKVAVSVWADPSSESYIGTFKATETAIEMKLHFLNNLPLALDDSSNINEFLKKNMESFIYKICNGKGKDRANKDLSLRNNYSWSNCILSNGERPLVGYAQQGGAYNRCIELEITEKPFKDASAVADVVTSNYGFAGKLFVEQIQDVDIEEIKDKQRYFKNRLRDISNGKSDKQIDAIACILTADYYAEKFIFQDGQNLDPAECVAFLTDLTEISEEQRAMEYIISKIESNSYRFIPNLDDDSKIECWGTMTDNAYNVYVGIFEELCNNYKIGHLGLRKWLKNKGWIKCSAGRTDLKVSVGGEKHRCVSIYKDMRDQKEIQFTNVGTEEIPFS